MASKKEAQAEKKPNNIITLKNEPLFESQTSRIPIKKISGDFYYYDGIRANGRTRICASKKDIKQFPAIAHSLGWVCK